MLADRIRKTIFEALKECGFGDAAPSDYRDVPLETPKRRQHGDYSTNLPLTLAKPLKRAPSGIAEEILSKLEAVDYLEKVGLAGPGFINLTLKPDVFQSVVREAIDAGAKYGENDLGRGRRLQVEFVSANPTGPLSVGHGRLAALGDALARILETCGYDVQREFYVNDVGNQIKNLAASVELRYFEALGREVSLEDAGYQGEYVREYALELKEKFGESLLEKDEDARRKIMADHTIKRVMEEQAESLKKFGVVYDRWFGEHELYDAKLIDPVLGELKEKGDVYEKEGALWFSSSKYSDSQDRVLRKSDGSSTYFLSDVVYHKNKYDRGFDVVIDVWGADHHGYIARMKSSMQALGIDPDALEIAVVQLVRFMKGGELVRMSKRTGNLVTLSDLVDDVGRDAARFFFLTRTKESHLDFDLELAKEQSEKNPMFYLQYAHARICSLLKKAEEQNLAALPGENLALLRETRELVLMKKIADFPWETQSAGAAREPHRIITFLTELAGCFHAFYHDHRVIADDKPELSKARLALCEAVRTVFANGLALLGIDAPESM